MSWMLTEADVEGGCAEPRGIDLDLNEIRRDNLTVVNATGLPTRSLQPYRVSATGR